MLAYYDHSDMTIKRKAEIYNSILSYSCTLQRKSVRIKARYKNGNINLFTFGILGLLWYKSAFGQCYGCIPMLTRRCMEHTQCMQNIL